MKRIILTTGLLVFIFTKSLSCVCDMKPELKTKEDLAEYNFIALVRIVRIDSILQTSEERAHGIEFEILELYKGEKVNRILVGGGHRTIKNSWTSCDLGENINDEWVISAYTNKRDGTLTTHLCTRTFRYKKADGYRYKPHPNEVTTLDKLRTMFLPGYTKPQYSGMRLEYYANGQKELEEYYKNKKLHGQRLSWYPNGQIEFKENFRKGKLDGEKTWYSEDGQLSSRRKYKNGLDSDTLIYWHDIDTAKIVLKIYSRFNGITEDSARALLSRTQISSKTVYDKKGREIWGISYHRNGALHVQIFNTYKGKTMEQIRRDYHSTGAIQAESFSRDYVPIGLYREWGENGNLIKSWEYDNEGRQINESIKIFNNK
jgi:antitoxin component YwqK of YwqJK toxin-antitoxin module